MKLKLFCLLLLAFHFYLLSFAQDTSICYLRDVAGRIREHNVDFLSMKLDVKFKEKEGMVIGNVKYQFKPIQYTVDTLFLNAPAINIKNVLLDTLAVKFTTDSNGVTIWFPQSLNWNKEYKLEINYEATPRKGIYFIGWNVNTANEEKNTYLTRKQIWTQGQGIDNRHWLPCYDDVNDKMMIETIITFDTNYTVISNGVLKEKKKNPDGSATWHYAMNKPMVPYLVMIAIDKYAYKDYKSKNGMVSRQYYYADRPETVIPTYQYSAEMMDWLSTELQVSYPWQVYSNTPVQDFLYGAMENTTATVFTDVLLCDARGNLERPYVGVNAHELTHQWFGDYITEYSGTHHWLHETFATYYSKQFTRHIYGEALYEWIKRAEQNTAVAADKADRYPVAHSKGGSGRQYPKGSAVVDMLRYVVGDSVYRKSVSAYLKKHAYSNVTSDDFKMTFMETAGVNLDWFFDQWLYRSGFPRYEVSYARQKDTVVFYANQTQKTDELTSFFKMPVVFEIYFKDGSTTVKKQWLSHAADTVYIPASSKKEIDFTLFDPGSELIKEVTFKKSFDEIAAQAEKAPHFIDRCDAVYALRDTSLEKKRDLLIRIFSKGNFYPTQTEIISQLSKDTSAAVTALFKRALHDKDYLVRRAAVDYMGEFPDSFRVALRADMEAMLEDSSYYTIENTLRKLCKSNPDKVAVRKYLDKVKPVTGLNNNVRIAWLELNSYGVDSATAQKFQSQLVGYTSNKYEFRTRVRAIEKLEGIKYCDKEFLLNLFNACAYTNGRLSGPAIKCITTLMKQPANLQMAKEVFSANTWRDWERKAIEPLLK